MSEMRERLSKLIKQIKSLQNERELLIIENERLRNTNEKLVKAAENNSKTENIHAQNSLITNQIEEHIKEIDQCLIMLNDIQS